MRGASLLLALESHLRHNSSASPASRRGSRVPCLVRVPVSHLTYLQAVLIGLLQGVSELFPVSSLGHSIIIPALIGGDWARNLNMTADKSPYLSFVVAVHVATAMALIVFGPPGLGADHLRASQLDPQPPHLHLRGTTRLAAHRRHDSTRPGRTALRTRHPNHARPHPR